MTPTELEALLLLLNRIPMNLVEQLWVQDFLTRLREALQAKPPKVDPPGVGE